MTDQPSHPFGSPGPWEAAGNEPGEGAGQPSGQPAHPSPAAPADPQPAAPADGQQVPPAGGPPPSGQDREPAPPGWPAAPGQGWQSAPRQGWPPAGATGWGAPGTGWAPPAAASEGAAYPGAHPGTGASGAMHAGPAYPGGPGLPGYPGGGSYPGGPQQFGPQGYFPPRKPGVVPLRPLAIGDLLDGGFQAIRRNAGSTLGLAVLVQLFSGLVSGLLSYPLLSQVFSADVMAGNDPDFDMLTGSLLAMLGGGVLAGIVTAVLLIVVQGAITVPVLRAVLNQRTRFAAALSLARPAIGHLLLLAMLYAAAITVALGIIVAVVVLLAINNDPGLAIAVIAVMVILGLPTAAWVWIKTAFAVHVVVAEGVGPLTGIRRSWALTRASWWRCFGILLLTGVIVGVVSSLITTPIGFIGGMLGGILAPADPGAFGDLMLKFSFASTILSSVAAGLGFAYQSAVSVLLYTDLRIRREGFDLALLGEFDSGADIGIPGRAAAPGSGGMFGSGGTPGTGSVSPGYPPAGPSAGRFPGAF